jgi:hypothetical protein
MAELNENQEAENANLRAMAESLDQNGGEPVSVEQSEEHAPEPEKTGVVANDDLKSSSEITSEKPGDKPGETERKRDLKTGKFIKTDADVKAEANKKAATDKAAAEKAKGEQGKVEGEPDKKDSEFVRKQKEQARLDKTWQNSDLRKTQLDAREHELAERERRIASLPPAQAPPRATKNGYTADEYEKAATEFIKEGEHESAVKALAAAREVREFEAQHYQKMHVENVEKAFNEDMAAVMQEFPDTAKADHPIAAEIQSILKANPWVQFVPQGFRKVAEIAQLRIDAKQNATVISELQEENKTLKADLAKRDSDAQLSASGTPGGPRNKSLSEMTGDEMRTHLRQQAEEFDAAGAA